MSKASRARNKEKRRKEKFAKKQAKKALYESYRDKGINKKSKRFQKKSRKKTMGVKHPFTPCGNPGCIKCYGVYFDPFLKDGFPFRMPHWMFQLWKKKDPIGALAVSMNSPKVKKLVKASIAQ